MTLDFPWILFSLMVVSGSIWLIDIIFFERKRAKNIAAGASIRLPIILDYAKTFFSTLLIVLIIRSFIVQLYHVPSGSLEPTVKPGELLLVNEAAYGLRLPVWHTELLSTGQPQRGDIALFHWPVNPKVIFIKRVIGIPGDRIAYINRQLTINGQPIAQKTTGKALDFDNPAGPKWPVTIKSETLTATPHRIYVCKSSTKRCPGHLTENFKQLIVPPHYYFMMGDNRDNSDDSRGWGLVSEHAFVGKAEIILASWHPDVPIAHWNKLFRWHRFGIRL